MFVMGAGPYADAYQPSLWSSASDRATLITMLDRARSRFVAAGGETSLDQDDEPRLELSIVTNRGRLERLWRDYAAQFVPISMLRATSMVTFKGGAGLLRITDIDTIVIDMTVLAAVCLFVMSARAQGMSPGPVFVLVMAALLTASLAYVVTNYGTLFRLRLFGVTPLWMLPVMIPDAGAARKNASELT